MLICSRPEYSAENTANIKCTVNGSTASVYGAFERASDVILTLCADRRAGIFDPVLEIVDDDSDTLYQLPFKRDQHLTSDEYICRIPTERDALFFCRIRYSDDAGEHYLTNPADGTDTYQITIYDREYAAPEWFAGGTMYHIFVDRFNRGGNEPCRDGTFFADSTHDCPQYAPHPGDPLKNNMFFGGDIPGIINKLDYIESLGVTTIYLSPIFEAASNHKYDTGNYMAVDSMFGGDDALKALIAELKKRDMHLILDGVFNHTGDDSIYFNKYGRYHDTGAYQSPDSAYADWYLFDSERKNYGSWWGIDILPTTNKQSEGYRSFIFGQGGVIEHYLKMGIDGWRLDVADELPEDFLAPLTARAKKTSPDSLIIGEVWEDASNKVAYSVRRKYFRNGELDSVMNYPWRAAVIDFILYGGAEDLRRAVMTICSHYPKDVCDNLMNFLGTHDTERILTVLGGKDSSDMTNDEMARTVMTECERAHAVRALRAAYTLLATLPGVPCIYYGDEAGMQGYKDPFNRRYYPWGEEDTELLSFFRRIGEIRRSNPEYAHADIEFLHADEDVIAFRRGELITAVNRGEKNAAVDFPGQFIDLISGKTFCGALAPMSAAILK